MRVDELLEALGRGERVSRQEYEVDKSTVDVLLDSGILERDEGGFLVAGPIFHLHVNQGDDS